MELNKEPMRKEFRRLDEYVAGLESENAELRELVRDMFYAVHPVDRDKFLTNVAELGGGVDGAQRSDE